MNNMAKRYAVMALFSSLFVMVLPACSESDAPKTNTPAAKEKTSSPTSDKKPLYDFAAWSGESAKPVSVSNVNDVFAVLGMSPKKKEDTLDFTGKSGTRYYLRDKEQVEFLNVVNSIDYLELTWIKPTNNDGAESKKVSLENTKKAYQLARSIMGDKGGELVKSMVTIDDFKAPEIVDGKTVKAASCEHFLCTLVVMK